MSASLLEASFDKDAIYELKYQVLSKRCVEVKKETDKIYERLLRCKQMLGKVLYERRALRDKLERQCHDKFSQAEIPEFQEEDFAYEVLISQKQACRDVGKGGISFSTPFTESKNGSSSQIPSQSVLISNVNNTSSGNRRPFKSNSKNGGGKQVTTGSGAGATAVLAKKDPHAPRKPVNAYFIFCERKRSFVQTQLTNEKNGEVDRKEVTRRLGQMWGALTNEEKNVYYDEYRKDKERYGLQMEEYINSKRPLDESCDPVVVDHLNLPSTSTSVCSVVPAKRKRIRKPKVSSNSSGFGQPIQSSASSPALPGTIAEESDNANLLPCADDDVFRLVKMENDMGIEGMSSPSLMPLEPTLEKLDPTSPAILLAAGDDATDEVFMSSHAIESPGVVNASSSGESFDHQSFLHSVAMPQLFCPGGNEMPVP